MAAHEHSSIFSSGSLDLETLRATLSKEAFQEHLRRRRRAVVKSILIVVALFGAAALLFWLI